MRLGAIGAGMIFRRYEAAAKQLNDVAITVVADTDPARRAAAQYAGYRAVSSIEQLLDEPIDAVLILTPNNTHAALASECLRRGLATFCEKPLAMTAEAARSLQSIATENKAFLYPAMHSRQRPEIRHLQEYSDAPVIEFDHLWHEDWRNAPAWYRDPFLSGGGVLLDIGINQLDWITRLTGPLQPQWARAVAATGCVEQCCRVRWSFAGGSGMTDLSWQHAPERRLTRLRTEDDRLIELDHDRHTVTRDGHRYGPWENDEYKDTLREFLRLCADPGLRFYPAVDEIAALLALIRHVYNGLDRMSPERNILSGNPDLYAKEWRES